MAKTRAGLIIGISLILLSVWQISSAKQDIQLSRIVKDGVPATVYQPMIVSNQKRPVVLVAHGFAASQNIMSSIALSLSHAGFTVITWDFNGHGSNANQFTSEDYADTLIENATTALAVASDMGLIDDTNYAILGHSMGSGAALSFAQINPETDATIAVSPVRQTVTQDLPKNLLLMAGSREGNFVRNAETLLEQAGGPGGDPSQGNARKLKIIPNVEHLSILFSKAAHAEARTWLEATFGAQPNAKTYSENRYIWYLIGMIGFFFVSYNFPKHRIADNHSNGGGRSLWRKVLLIIIGAIGGTLILWMMDIFGIELQYSFNLLVGGYLILWFGVCGAVSLLALRINPGYPKLNQISGGFIGFTLLWLGVGLLGRSIWLEWLLVPKRLVLWPLAAVLLLPWFLMIGESIRDSTLLGLIGWWLIHSLVVILCLLLSVVVIPGMGFLILIIPIVPVLLALHMLYSIPWGRGWAFGLSGSMFISWTLLAVFPIL